MLGIELRRYAKFQVYIFKTDSGKKARGEGDLIGGSGKQAHSLAGP